MPSSSQPRFLIAGKLRRDYILLPDGRSYLDVPGGSLLYAAAGLRIWENDIGLLGRVGNDYPREWIDQAAKHDLNIEGIHWLSQPVDLRSFTAYAEDGTAQINDPVAHFARFRLPYPKELLGLQILPPQLDNRTRLSTLAIRQNDIPSDYLDASAAHICPLDYLSHNLLPSTFRQGQIATLTLDPSPGYMNPTFWDDIPSIVTGLTAFLTNEEKLRNLFHGRTSDVWEMAETIASYGCELVVIKRGELGQLLYDRFNRSKWIIPAYPVTRLDPTGAGDAFCGGFLAGYRRTYDPLQAVLYGNVSAAFVVESSGPFYPMEALPRLAEARLQVIQDMVRKA
ncbi:MAG TPA: carbohydrate kinase family protein [Anaerolineaceae bacterium]|nr:carbohydrate kinase family protein [Anaerolineaceae bacterium]